MARRRWWHRLNTHRAPENAPGPWSLRLTEKMAIETYQFCGLMWATEYNAHHARLDQGIDAQTVNGMNTLLMAYASLEALVTETAACIVPELYADKQFRRAGIVAKYARLLEVTGRAGEPMPDVIEEISDHRIALTHSEPDNERTTKLASVISATDAARFAAEVRIVAEWLWQKKRPGAVAYAFDEPNLFMRMLR